MAKKTNPVVYRSGLYKYTNILFGAYSNRYLTNNFVKLISIYWYLITVFTRLLTIKMFQNSFFLKNRNNFRYLTTAQPSKKLSYIKKKKRKKKIINRLFNVKAEYQRSFIQKRYHQYKKHIVYTLNDDNEYTIYMADQRRKKRYRYRWKQFFREYRKSELDQTIYKKQLSLLFYPLVQPAKTAVITKIPTHTPTIQSFRKKFFLPKRRKFFSISDLFIVQDKETINVFFSYSLPIVHQFRYFASFYKQLLKTRHLCAQYRSFFIKKAPFMLSKGLNSFGRRHHRFEIVKNLLKKYTKIQNRIYNRFEPDLLLYFKNNIQQFSGFKVNLFFFNTAYIGLYQYAYQNYKERLEKFIQCNDDELEYNIDYLLDIPQHSRKKKILALRKMKSFFVEEGYGPNYFSSYLASRRRYIRQLSSGLTVAHFINAFQSVFVNGSAFGLKNLIVHQFRRAQNQKSFFYYLKRAVTIAYNLNKSAPRYLTGVQIVINGRLNGRNRTQKHVINLGNIALIKKSKILDFAKGSSTTRYGTIGIKVYFFFN